MKIQNHLYEIKIHSVVDGDTLKINGLDHGFGLWGFTSRGRTKSGKVRHYSIRIAGINAPETRRGWWSKNLTDEEIRKELDAGKIAKAFLKNLADKAKKAFLNSHRSGADNFGRLLGDAIFLFDDGSFVDAGAVMLQEGLVLPYEES